MSKCDEIAKKYPGLKWSGWIKGKMSETDAIYGFLEIDDQVVKIFPYHHSEDLSESFNIDCKKLCTSTNTE